MIHFWPWETFLWYFMESMMCCPLMHESITNAWSGDTYYRIWCIWIFPLVLHLNFAFQKVQKKLWYFHFEFSRAEQKSQIKKVGELFCPARENSNWKYHKLLLHFLTVKTRKQNERENSNSPNSDLRFTMSYILCAFMYQIKVVHEFHEVQEKSFSRSKMDHFFQLGERVVLWITFQ